MRHFRTAFVAVLALALPSCAWLGLDEDDGSRAAASGPATECPLHGVLEGTGDTTRHRGASVGRDSMVLQARVTDVSLRCTEASPGVAAVDLTIEITANRGPAAQDSGEGVRYFVEIADPADRPIARDSFDVGLPFGDAAQVRQREELALEIPLSRGSSVADYRVYVGFDR